MTEKLVAGLAVVLLIFGTMVGSVSLAPTTGQFSDGETFDDNQIGAADDWGTFTFDADAPAGVNVSDAAFLTVTIENAGDGIGTADYEIVIDNETVDEGHVDLGVDEEWNRSYEFDTDDGGEIDWKVTVDGGTENGTLNVDGDGESEEDDGAETASGGDEETEP